MSKSYVTVAARAAETSKLSGRRKFDSEIAILELGLPLIRRNEEGSLETRKIEQRPATDPVLKIKADQMKEIRCLVPNDRRRRDQIRPIRLKSSFFATQNLDLPE